MRTTTLNRGGAACAATPSPWPAGAARAPPAVARPPPPGRAAAPRTRPSVAAAVASSGAAAALEAAAAAAGADASAWVEVGVVGPPHGVRGEFKVQPLTDFPEERLAEPGPRWLRAAAPPGRAPRGPPAPPARVELEWGRASVFKGREVWLVKLDGVECPEDVGPLRGQLLLVPTAARAPLEDEDEVYTTDLLGLAVFLAAGGEEVGAVVEVLGGTGTHDVLRIRLREGFEPAGGADEEEEEEEKEEEEEEEERRGQAGAAPAAADGRPRFALVPFVRSIVPVVDVAGGRMEISPPAGLLELAAAGAPRVRRAESAGRRDRRNPRPVRGRPAPAAEGAPAAP